MTFRHGAVSLRLVLLALVILLLPACQHEAFPAPEGAIIDGPNDTSGQGSTGKPCHPDSIYYQRDVQPILNSHCAFAGCHGQGFSANGVDLSSYSRVIATADVRPGDLEGSDLYEVITETRDDKRMPPPPNAALSAEKIAIIRQWILQGAQNLTCEGCDTTDLRYSQIKGIIDANCASCHRPGNPITPRNLDSYASLKEALLNTNLLARVQAEAGVPVMPPGGPMNDCEVQSLIIWYENGMPE